MTHSPASTPTAADVDRAVRAVLAGMSSDRGRRAGTSGRGEVDRVFGGGLFSIRHAEAIEPGVFEVRVAVGTVVTPLAIDHLKRRGVALRYVSGGGSSRRDGRRPGEWAFAVEGRGRGTAEALRRALLVGSWSEIEGEEAAAWVDDDPDRGVLLLAAEASVAAWRASRWDNVRAAVATDVDAVTRAVRHLGVNLLVVEPAGLSIPFVRAMAEAFRRGGAPEIPEGLR